MDLGHPPAAPRTLSLGSCAWRTMAELTHAQEQGGLRTRKFRFLPEYGQGYFEHNRFDGLTVALFDVALTHDLNIYGHRSGRALELSYLMEGEQIIRINGRADDLVYESQESYLVYLASVSGSVRYYKSQGLKEVKIRMYPHFMAKHHLDDPSGLCEQYALSKLSPQPTRPLGSKTQALLIELMTDTRQGLAKRLFLESKVLELLSLQLEEPPPRPADTAPTDHLVKKLYRVRAIVRADLTVQYATHELAHRVGLNDFVLKKEFKRVFGTTVFEYALGLRMEQAQKLLRHSTRPVYEISEAVGYKNATHFSAAFKKAVGTTPKKFRGLAKGGR